MKNLLIVLVIILTSCSGAKKTQNKSEELKIVTETKVDSITKTVTDLKESKNTNVKTESTTKVDDKGETITKETTYEVSDKSKPGTIIDEKGNKLVLDNIKKTTKETIQKNNTITENVKKKDSISDINKDVTIIDEGKVNKNTKNNTDLNINTNNSDRKQFSILDYAWYIVPILIILVILILLYKKSRDKLPF